jgi:hypothetical protein
MTMMKTDIMSQTSILFLYSDHRMGSRDPEPMNLSDVIHASK